MNIINFKYVVMALTFLSCCKSFNFYISSVVSIMFLNQLKKNVQSLHIRKNARSFFQVDEHFWIIFSVNLDSAFDMASTILNSPNKSNVFLSNILHKPAAKHLSICYYNPNITFWAIVNLYDLWFPIQSPILFM